MIAKVEMMGRKGLEFCSTLGYSGLFLASSVFRKPSNKNGLRLIIQELYSTGVLSLVIVSLSALFIGFVVGLQGYNTLDKFGATPNLGQLIALSITRELGPVICALLYAGRAGSALTAEIGLMKSTEQLDCLDVMGVNPIHRIIAPRFWGGLISLPLLTLLFNAISIFGGYLVSVPWLGLDSGIFWSNMQSSVDFYLDVWSGIEKSIVFGILIAWIAVFQGYNTVPTAEGIGRATTRTVVYGSVAVLVFDFILTAMMIGGW